MNKKLNALEIPMKQIGLTHWTERPENKKQFSGNSQFSSYW